MMICPRELRYYARNKFSYAVASGKVPRAKGLVCVDCGAAATRYDHRDYRKPFDVDPVCTACDNRRGQALPDIDGPHVFIDWATRKKPSKCGECGCSMFGNVSDRIKDGIAKRQKVWT